MTDRPASSVDPKLLEILVCPVTKGTLEYDREKQELVSRSAKLAYPIPGAGFALRQARLSDPRWHSDHAARGSAAAGLREFVMAGLVPAIHVFVR
jgi:hypothetical protein